MRGNFYSHGKRRRAADEKEQCEKNAEMEGVKSRVDFRKGDAAHLDFPDETFAQRRRSRLYRRRYERNFRSGYWHSEIVNYFNPAFVRLLHSRRLYE